MAQVQARQGVSESFCEDWLLLALWQKAANSMKGGSTIFDYDHPSNNRHQAPERIIINNNIVNRYTGTCGSSGGFVLGLLLIIVVLAFLELWRLWVTMFISSLIVWLVIKAAIYLKKSIINATYQREIRYRELSRRADYQNQLVQKGNPIGTYGQYTPYTMPLPDAVLNDYDDGLYQWR
jgi:hypothetical protein